MKYLLIITTLMVLQACVATPSDKTMKPVETANNDYSIDSLKQQEEQKYAKLLNELQGKSARQDAQRAIQRGQFHVLGYQSGRGGLKIPGIDGMKNNCAVKQLDGMGDMIFGENHLRYRLALSQYAKQFNLQMLPHCS